MLMSAVVIHVSKFVLIFLAVISAVVTMDIHKLGICAMVSKVAIYICMYVHICDRSGKIDHVGTRIKIPLIA